MRSHGPWKIKKSDHVYADPFVKMWRDDVIRPDGADGQHIVVSLKAGVCVLAIDTDWNVHLTDEFHYAIGRNSLEAVSGGIEPDESADATAVRELQEELGLRASHLEFITTTDPFTTVITSPTRLYIATDLEIVESNPEGTEQILHRVVPIGECYQYVLEGKITHSPTCILILIAYERFRSHELTRS